ncbi:hydrolase 1, exosortase A system-associated [Sphingosinicella sp. BN140058]|uniref:hydrolase 1, exosortase A system-associated n=1 Tax=Sphingosinicella sp. BN140058 TaxID=1892855 RepID=UPI0010115D0F|nr:hydrolase 1, exosortase A system-associated [Sphingosinicella sp. BN140058]QAY79152.1 hydrolase 1, exosortase A system-associated [Sphingosinicella sp. BN140058]
MRRLLTIDCGGARLGASLDLASGTTGLLFVTGGSQTRIGSHRLFERLAAALAGDGTPCFRFDRRGIGDSEGEDGGWRSSGPDITAATATFRRECPSLERIVGIGLCDGATALALFGADAGVDGLILLNPWLVETRPGELPAAAIRRHYQERLTTPAGLRKILFGSVSWKKALTGIRKMALPENRALSDEAAQALRRHAGHIEAILASDDETAIAAERELARPVFDGVLTRAPAKLPTGSHTFARPADLERLRAAVEAALARL